jgi:NADH:ubiquinone oxidoreductase subunit F (NADH-binding)
MTRVRLLAGTTSGRPVGLARHLDLHGPLPTGGADLVAAVRRAGLRGRGGAGFPTALKLEAVAGRRRTSELLVNAAEGDPLSAKDRVLTRVAPHLVIDGALAAARAVGARRITIAVPEDAGPSGDALGRAVDERGDRERVTIRSVPVAYLAGEESALIRHLGGGPLKPTVVPPRPAERGLRRRPTLVQNPETLAHVALIARHGPAWFREVGTEEQPGSALVTVTGAVAQPGVQEIALGDPFESVLRRAGGAVEPLRALLVGGYHGTWVDAAAAPSLTLDDAALGRVGATLGAGIVVALGASACPVQELAQSVGWLAAQSAQQCGPCANGLPALAGLLAAMAMGTAPRDAGERLARWSRDVSGRGACHLPDGAARLVTSGARVFAAEIADHLELGPCDACRWHATIVPVQPRRARVA